MPLSQPATKDAPMDPETRRARLLRISSSPTVPSISGTPTQNYTNTGAASRLSDNDTIRPSRRRGDSVATETTSLASRDGTGSYGAVHTPRGRNFLLALSRTTTRSPTGSIFGRRALRGLSSARPISAYDAPLNRKETDTEATPDQDAKINGIRVWYSSYTSIDWLHDAIKDSLRFSKLRKRKSIRAQASLAFDKSQGWIIVTIVGFLTAVVAFLVVRGEQLLFDFKDGYCAEGWWKAQRFCCPATAVGSEPEGCEAWKSWPEAFKAQGNAGELVEYISYTTIALTLALVSTLLTIYLTKSTTFQTRKESGVAGSPLRSSNSNGKHPVSAPGRKILYYAAGSGIPEIKTILSGFVIHGYLGVRVLFTKSVGLALSVASGLSLGKEGPFVHIASCIGNIVSRIASKYELNEAKRREILSAACAAGVAVAFGAPIGGTLFSLEEVSYFFPPKVMWRSFFCAMTAAITLKMLDPFGTGKLVLFQVTYDKDWHGYELVPFLFLGLFGGVYGAYFSKLNYRWSKHVRAKTWLGSSPIVEVLLITLITSCFSFINPYTRMGGTELVYNLFSECHPGSDTHSHLCISAPGNWQHAWSVISAILTAMLVKAGLTIVTFGIKLPAGIFIPTLGVGACAGRILGIVMEYLQAKHPDGSLFSSCGGNLNCVVPGLYAMVGAAAALSGVTRTTVSLAVIMFELTDTLTYAVPVMLSVLVAKTVADFLEPKGIYDLVIELSQLPYLDSKVDYAWDNLQINDVVSKDVSSIRIDEKNTVQSLSEKLIELISSGENDMGFPILQADPHEDGVRLVGYIGANELEHALSIVADDPDAEVHFGSNASYTHDLTASLSSFAEPGFMPPPADDPFDFTPYMDQAPLTLTNRSPLEMLHRFFVKLGARYVVVVDSESRLYEGIIEKKRWLAFLTKEFEHA